MIRSPSNTTATCDARPLGRFPIPHDLSGLAIESRNPAVEAYVDQVLNRSLIRLDWLVVFPLHCLFLRLIGCGEWQLQRLLGDPISESERRIIAGTS